MAIFLTATLVAVLAGEGAGASLGWSLAELFALQLGLGAAFGAVGGLAIVQAVDRVELEPGLYPLVVLGLALLLFAATNLAGGSGFLAVYLAGLLAGNAELRPAAALRRFLEGMTWLAQIAMFLTLGLLASPSTFTGILLPATALGLVLVFVARPVAVVAVPAAVRLCGQGDRVRRLGGLAGRRLDPAGDPAADARPAAGAGDVQRHLRGRPGLAGPAGLEPEQRRPSPRPAGGTPARPARAVRARAAGRRAPRARRLPYRQGQPGRTRCAAAALGTAGPGGARWPPVRSACCRPPPGGRLCLHLHHPPPGQPPRPAVREPDRAQHQRP